MNQKQIIINTTACHQRSLKKRIKKTMRIINFISVAVFSCILLVFFFFSFWLLGTSYSNYTASQMSYGIGQFLDYNSPNQLNYFLKELNPDHGDFAKFDPSDLSKGEAPNFIHLIFNNAINIFKISAVEFKVWKGDKLIYESAPPGRDNFTDLFYITDFFSTVVTKDIVYQDGTAFGQVGVRLNPMLLITLLAIISALALVLLFINAIVTSIFTKILTSVITKPLTRLKDELNIIADGNIECLLSQEIIVKKPVLEVQNLITASNKILYKLNEYVLLVNAQKDEVESQASELEAQAQELEAQTIELEAQKDELEAQNASLEDRSTSLKFINTAYVKRTQSLQNLLNNVGQGFLTIGSDLLINPEYSYECEKMILSSKGEKLSGMCITNALFSEMNGDSFIADLFKKIFESPQNQKALFLSLLPEELTLNNRYLSIAYKLVCDIEQDEVILIILTDMTHTKNLQKQMDQERNNLNMIVKVLLNREEFLDLIDGYKSFIQKDFSTLQENQTEEVLRELHTYKGIFSQYYLDHVTTYLNQLEDSLYSNPPKCTIAELKECHFIEDLEKDMSIIESYIGHDYLYNQDIYTLKEENIIEIENKIKRILSPAEYLKILPIVKSIRYKSFKELLKTFPDYTLKLSERIGKSIHPFVIEGDDVYVDHLVYGDFSKTLVHLFRNCVDHGVETEDERIELGKPQIATISCRVNGLEDGFEIIIRDDGKGVDIENLTYIALEKGLITQDALSNMTEQEQINLMFLDGLTTKEEASAVSGRGVGMAAVKEAIEAINGRINVMSSPHVGTSFIIWLPKIHWDTVIETTPKRLLEHIISVSDGIFASMNLDICNYKLVRTNKITLNRISALISIKGTIDAMLIISISDDLGKKLVNAFLIEAVEESMVDDYIEDVLGEISNTILGNVLGLFEEDGVYLSIGVPAMISNKEAYVKYTDSQIYSIVHDGTDGSIIISLLLLDPDHQFIGNGDDDFDCTFDEALVERKD